MNTIGKTERETQRRVIALFNATIRAHKQAMMQELLTGKTILL